MTFRGVNEERLAALISAGLSAAELRKFFKECRPKLLIAHEKVQNAPKSHAAAVTQVVRFSDAAHRIFGAWLLSKGWNSPEGLPSQLAPSFRSIEKEGVKFSEDGREQLYKFGLLELYKPDSLPDWITFLKTSIPRNRENQDTTVAVPDSALPTDEDWTNFTKSLLEPQASEHIADRVLSAASAISKSVQTRDKSLLETVPLSAASKAMISELIPLAPQVPPQMEQHRGVIAKAPIEREFDPHFDYLLLDVVASSSGFPGSGPFFADVLAYIDDGEVFHLSNADTCRAVPDEGRIILYPDRGFHSPPTSQPASYRVTRIPTTKSIKVRAERATRLLTPFEYLPHASNELDEIRDHLIHRARKHSGDTPIFVTTDTRCVRPSVEHLSGLLSPSFDWVLDYWVSMRGYELGNGAYALAPLPPPDGQIDCAPVDVVARRLLKTLSERKSISLTKHQIREVADALREQPIAIDVSRHDRVVGCIENLSDGLGEYADLVSDLMKSPQVSRDIEARVALAVQAAEDRLTKEKKALEALKVERVAAEKKIVALKNESERKTKELKAAIHKAFEDARDKELETLGQSAVWQTILGTTRRDQHQDQAVRASQAVGAPAVEETPQLPSQISRVVTLEKLTPSDVFRIAGILDSQCDHLGRAVSLASRYGIPIALTGPGCGHFGALLIRSISEDPPTEISIPVGLLSGSEVAAELERITSGGVLLREANASDMSIYGAALLDRLLLQSIGRGEGTTCLPVVLTDSCGPTSLPWPDVVWQTGLKIDLGEVESLLSRQEVADPQSPLQRKVLSRLERVANATDVDASDLDVLRRLLVIARPTTLWPVSE